MILKTDRIQVSTDVSIASEIHSVLSESTKINVSYWEHLWRLVLLKHFLNPHWYWYLCSSVSAAGSQKMTSGERHADATKQLQTIWTPVVSTCCYTQKYFPTLQKSQDKYLSFFKPDRPSAWINISFARRQTKTTREEKQKCLFKIWLKRWCFARIISIVLGSWWDLLGESMKRGTGRLFDYHESENGKLLFMPLIRWPDRAGHRSPTDDNHS